MLFYRSPHENPQPRLVTDHPAPVPPRIFLIAEVFPPAVGGSGRWAWELYRRLDPAPTCVAAGECENSSRFDAQTSLRIERVPLAFGSWGVASPGGLSGYARVLRRLDRLSAGSGALQIHCGKSLPEGALGWALGRRHGWPYVVYVHGEELNVAASSRELRWLTGRVLRGARLVIANSENTKATLERGWAEGTRIRVLTPGVDTGTFVPALPSPEARRSLGWADRPVLLTVGRLQRRKGHDTVIRALPAVRRDLPDVLYVVLGNGAERDRLERLAQELGVEAHVQFRGEPADEEIVRCYQQCDLFVLANREVDGDFEGFGMVLVEAQACGRPVVAGRSGGTPETLVEGSTGELVTGGDECEVAEVVVRLLGDRSRLEAMGARARVWAVERFDWEALAARAAAMFRGL